MRTKTNDFFLATASSDYDVIVLTETWLQNDVSNTELSTNYNIYRCDRSNMTSNFRRGGGTLIAVKRSICSTLVQLDGSDSLEQVVVKLSLPDKSVYVCGIYLRPNSEPDKFTLHSNCMLQLTDKAARDDSIMIVGDYNLPHLLWSYDDDVDSYIPTNASTEQELTFTECMIGIGLQQICDVRNTNGRLLDLAFVSSSTEFELFEAPIAILPPDRHHKPLVLRFSARFFMENDLAMSTSQDFDFNRCNYDAVIEELRLMNWEQILHSTDTNAAVTSFYDAIFEIISRHTPLRRTNVHRSNNQPWWNDELRHSRNVLRKARRRFLRHRTAANRTLLHRLEAEHKERVSSSFREYIFRIQDEVKTNPSTFWRYAKSRKTVHSTFSEMSFNGSTSHDIASSAELFADFFKSVYSVDPPVVSPESLNSLPSYNIHLPRPTFTVADVINALNAVDPSKGPGSDKLPPVFIRRCAEELGPPVCLLFNLSLSEAVFPDAWKLSAVTPIHKAGNIHRVDNYRPISILCCLAKTLELLIHNRMYAAAKPMISQYQHGFVKNRSTTTNLMSYASTLNSSLEKRCQVDSVYIDFSKAFDKVPHELTLMKFEKLGFPCWLIKWLRSYLQDRSAYVKLSSAQSSHFATSSGVPQGSHLGPLIFIIFINDLSLRLNSLHLMYADDLKIYRIISSLVDCVALQQDIHTVADWCASNGMETNTSKCKVISFSRSRTPLYFEYGSGGISLDRVLSIKDLGVIFDCKMSFNEHITTTISKAFAMLGFIRRNAVEFHDVYALKALYCSLVRSVLEYAVQIWTPHHETHIARIERVQRCFVRFALRRLPWSDRLRLPPYVHRCQLIRLETLRQRRTYLQRMFAFDILNNRIDCSDLLQHANFFVPARSTRQRSSFRSTTHRTVFGQNHPLEKCFNLLNDVDFFDYNISRNLFKTRIRELA